MTAEVQSSQQKEERHLVVRVADRRCAVPASRVRRVVRSLVVYPVPGAAHVLLGLAQLGGEPFPVLDLGLLLGRRAAGSGARRVTVVVHSRRSGGDGLIGLAVEEALGVRTVAAWADVVDEAERTPGEVGEDDRILRIDPDRIGQRDTGAAGDAARLAPGTKDG